MTQRTAIVLLAIMCLGLSWYLVLTSLIIGKEDAGTWEKAARNYVEEYHRWLAESPNSGWARVEALAEGPELGRIQSLRNQVHETSGWLYKDGDYRLLLQAGGKALVAADYTLTGGSESREVHEAYLLEKTLQGIKVSKVMGGGQ